MFDYSPYDTEISERSDPEDWIRAALAHFLLVYTALEDELIALIKAADPAAPIPHKVAGKMASAKDILRQPFHLPDSLVVGVVHQNSRSTMRIGRLADPESLFG